MKKNLTVTLPFNGALGIGRTLAVAALCLCAAAPLWAEQHSSRAHHAPANPPEQEESVLVATREAPTSGTSTHDSADTAIASDALEPISQSSDFTPDLATAELATATDQGDDPASNFGDALTKIATPTKATTHAPAKLQPLVQPEETALPASHKQRAATTATTTASGSARRAAAARTHSAHFEPVKFQNLTVGKTSKHELITAWGTPAEENTSSEGEVLVYQKSPFKSIEALLGANDIVSSIKITLASPLESKQLATQLGLDRLDPVTVCGDADEPICHAFPERGVLFMFGEPENVTPVDNNAAAAKSPLLVAHVVLQPIDACAFAYRAESRLHGPYAQNINDLKAAISLDPELGRAYWLLARIYIATGQADLADSASAEACDIEPNNASFQLCRAKAHELKGEYDDAVLGVRGVLDREDLTKIDRAQALHQMAQLASLGDREIASKTIPFETRAIEIADKLAASTDVRERRAAKQLLVEAHVAIAEEVARQPYNDKVESLSQWIGRASGLAEDFISKDKGSVELRLFIAQHALNALAGFKPTLDPAPWIAEAEESAKTLLAQTDDQMWQERIKWELGIAYLHALRVEHTRRQTDGALKYGQLAIDNLAIGASSRQAVHSSEQMVGQLYFQMGAVYAVHKLDHNKAVQWYDKAVPLLTSKRPASELYAPRREGEMLVSMGVSYWQLGNQAQALELTESGVRIVESAVEGGVLGKSTLAVPYGNLSTMYKQMGENTNAAKYAELAKGVASSEPKSSVQEPQRVGRTQSKQMRSTKSR